MNHHTSPLVATGWRRGGGDASLPSCDIFGSWAPPSWRSAAVWAAAVLATILWHGAPPPPAPPASGVSVPIPAPASSAAPPVAAPPPSDTTGIRIADRHDAESQEVNKLPRLP